jgi:hypothetical protein
VIADVISSAPRQVAPGVWWLPKCLASDFTGVVCHTHSAPYLIVGDDATLLFDTGPPAHWGAVERDLDAILGGRRLDWIVPSHPEVPHCANVERLLTKYPDAMLAGNVSDYHLYFPELASRFVEHPARSIIDLGGGHRFVFLEAPVKDMVSTQWGYDEAAQMMFVADAFSFTHHIPPEDTGDLPVHLDGECTLISSEIGKPPAMEQIVWINERALFWTRYADPEPFLKRVEELLREFPTKLVAPAHGAVIDDIDVVLPVIWEAYRLSYRGSAP